MDANLIPVRGKCILNDRALAVVDRHPHARPHARSHARPSVARPSDRAPAGSSSTRLTRILNRPTDRPTDAPLERRTSDPSRRLNTRRREPLSDLRRAKRDAVCGRTGGPAGCPGWSVEPAGRWANLARQRRRRGDRGGGDKRRQTHGERTRKLLHSTSGVLRAAFLTAKIGFIDSDLQTRTASNLSRAGREQKKKPRTTRRRVPYKCEDKSAGTV